jgi:hypothetical protein
MTARPSHAERCRVGAPRARRAADRRARTHGGGRGRAGARAQVNALLLGASPTSTAAAYSLLKDKEKDTVKAGTAVRLIVGPRSTLPPSVDPMVNEVCGVPPLGPHC